MDYKDLFINKISLLRELVLFTQSDLEEHWVDKNIFSKWIKNKYIIEQYKNIYSLTEDHLRITELTSLLLAVKYDDSAYLSFESALIDYWVYLESINGDTFRTNKEKYKIQYTYWNFYYYPTYVPNFEDFLIEEVVDIWNRAMWLVSTTKYKKAILELALVDFLSKYERVQDDFDFFDTWLYKELLTEKLNSDLLLKIANSTNKENVIKSVNNLINWINN